MQSSFRNRKYELLRFKYSFGKDTDIKGRPTSLMRGGTFYFQIESTEENEPLEILLREDMGHYVKGNIRVFQEYDDKTIRNISFEDSVFFVGEYMQAYPSMPMITTFALSPLRLDYNDRVRLDRRWAHTHHGLWEEYKPEKSKIAKAVAQTEAKSSMRIVDAY